MNQTVIEVEKEETGTKAVEDGKSPFFLPESHSLLAVAESIGDAAFDAIDPSVKRKCQQIERRRRRDGFWFSVK
ncbi:hypothetical protein ACQ86N_22935 [Puia sp. P3]|jgi:hypothetical protein|uniref:hypothetical protein n=1 Tax=Puia sp. P3 TaxID=3423952 RepID=UPI003D6715F8